MQPKDKSISSIGLVGFGAFGELIAQHLHSHFPLYIFDLVQRGEHNLFGGRAIVCEIATVAKCDVIILAVPVNNMSSAIRTLRPHLRPGAVVVDVGSVKVKPVHVMAAELPPFVDIVGTHPLFGPQSAKRGIEGLKIAVCPVRGLAAYRIAAFLRRALGLQVFITDPDGHDREVAVVQGLTHLIAHVLDHMEPLPTRLTTTSFDLLLQATEMVRHDAPSVFLAIEKENPYATCARERFFALAEETKLLLEGTE